MPATARHHLTRSNKKKARAEAAEAAEAGEVEGAEDEAPKPPKVYPREPVATAPKTERAILTAVIDRRDPRGEKEDPLEELAALAKTAGVVCIPERVVQRRDRPDVTTYVGKGTVERLGELLAAEQANVVIFDNDLSPAQRRNLEKALSVKVLDRTEVILDIFAQHARSMQARLQVELAQLEYALPRVRGLWTHLDTGVGRRAAGEKQIEVDKRLLRIRIQEIKDELDALRARKERQLAARDQFTVAIVGYTNAGKSTLMNRLTDAGVYVADKLFATLDTRTKAWGVGPNRVVLLSDTVGFIRQLPHHLVESFHATLEEVVNADLLLHVVDASDADALDHARAVRDVLESLGCGGRPELVALNKVDRVAEPELLPWLERRVGRSVRISARSGEGIDELRHLVNELAAARESRHRVVIDVREGAAIAWLEGQAEVISKALDEERLVYEVRCSDQVMAALRSKTRDRAQLQVELLQAAAPEPVQPPKPSLDGSGSDIVPPLPSVADAEERHPMARGLTSKQRSIHKHT